MPYVILCYLVFLPRKGCAILPGPLRRPRVVVVDVSAEELQAFWFSNLGRTELLVHIQACLANGLQKCIEQPTIPFHVISYRKHRQSCKCSCSSRVMLSLVSLRLGVCVNSTRTWTRTADASSPVSLPSEIRELRRQRLCVFSEASWLVQKREQLAGLFLYDVLHPRLISNCSGPYTEPQTHCNENDDKAAQTEIPMQSLSALEQTAV